jgi:hypothetical protein
LQSATDLGASPIAWGNEGSALTGTGGTLSFSSTTDGAAKFFRVLCQ